MPELTQTQAKPRRLPLLGGVLLAALLGGGGFVAVQSGVAANWLKSGQESFVTKDIGFVAIDPIIASIQMDDRLRHLRLSASLEVERQYQTEVARLMPRILDVLNGYLRAVEPAEFGEPGALIRLRAHLLRRIQIVTGEGRVRDLLITEFVIN